MDPINNIPGENVGMTFSNDISQIQLLQHLFMISQVLPSDLPFPIGFSNDIS
jgi:hypothetical protein